MVDDDLVGREGIGLLAEESVGHAGVGDLEDLSRLPAEIGVEHRALLELFEVALLALGEVLEPVEPEHADDLDFRLGPEVPPAKGSAYERHDHAQQEQPDPHAATGRRLGGVRAGGVPAVAAVVAAARRAVADVPGRPGRGLAPAPARGRRRSAGQAGEAEDRSGRFTRARPAQAGAEAEVRAGPRGRQVERRGEVLLGLIRLWRGHTRTGLSRTGLSRAGLARGRRGCRGNRVAAPEGQRREYVRLADRRHRQAVEPPGRDRPRRRTRPAFPGARGRRRNVEFSAEVQIQVERPARLAARHPAPRRRGRRCGICLGAAWTRRRRGRTLPLGPRRLRRRGRRARRPSAG